MGIDIAVYELSEGSDGDVFHNRCILTEHGGVMIGHGFGVINNPNHTDDLTLMDGVICNKKWWQFMEDRHFEVV